MNKAKVVALSGLLVTAMAVGVTPAMAEGDPIEVTAWVLSQEQYFQPIADAFNEEHPDIKVTISSYDTDGIKEAEKVAASSATLPNVWFNWGGSLGGFYAENGLTYNLNDYAKEHDWADKFTESAMSLCTYDDALTGYPNSYNVIGMYYRKDVFDQYGLKVPETFEEFEDVCKTLKENGVTPMYAGGLNGWHTMRFVEQLIEHYAGAEKHDAMSTFKESYDDETVTKAFEKYKEWVDNGYFEDGFLTMDANDTLMPLSSGQCAMTLEGQWQDSNIVAAGLDMDQYGAFAFPAGETNRLSSFGDMFEFNAKNTEEELDACVQYLDYYFDHIAEYDESYTMPKSFKASPMPEGQPNVATLFETADKNGTFTITDQAFPTEVADVLFKCQDAVANDSMEAGAAGSAIQEAIEKYNSK